MAAAPFVRRGGGDGGQFELQDMRRCVDQVWERTQRLEDAARQIRADILADVERRLGEHGGGPSVQQLAHAVDALEARVVELRHCLPESVTAERISRTVESCAGLEAKAADLLSALLVGTERIRHLEATVSGLDSKVKAQGEMDFAAEVLELRARVDSTHSRVNSFAASLREREDSALAELRQLRASIREAQSQISNAEHSMQEKAGSEHMTRVLEAVSQVGARVERSEQHVHRQLEITIDKLDKQVKKASAEHVEELRQSMAKAQATVKQQLELSLGGVDRLFKDIEQAMQMKVSAHEFEEFKVALAKGQAQIKKVERSLHENAGLEQMQEMRRTIQTLQSHVASFAHTKDNGVSNNEIQKLVQTLKRLQGRIEDIERALLEKTDVVQTQSLTLKVSSFERTVAVISDRTERLNPLFDCVEQLADQMQEMKNIIVKVQEQTAVSSLATSGLGPALTGNVAGGMSSTVEQAALGTQVLRGVETRPGFQVEQHVAHHEREIRVLEERMQRLELAHDQARAQTKALERGLEAKVDGEDLLRRVEGALLKNQAGQRLQEQTAASSPSVDAIQADMRHCQAATARIQAQMGTIAEGLQKKVDVEQLQTLQSAITSIQARFAGMEQTAHGRSDASLMQQLSSDISNVQVKVTKLDHTLQLKADSKDVQQLGETLSGLRARLPSFDQSHQLEGIRRHIASLEQTAQEKVAFGQGGGGAVGVQTLCQLQQLVGIVTGLEGKLSALEQAVQEKAGTGLVQQVKGKLSDMEVKVHSVDQDLQEKADAGQLQQVRSLVGGMQAQLATVEQELHEKVGSEQLQQLRSALGSLRAQASSTEQALHSKAGSEQVQALRISLGTAEARLAGLEQRAAAGEELCQAVGAMQQATLRQQASALRARQEGQDWASCTSERRQLRLPAALGPHHEA